MDWYLNGLVFYAYLDVVASLLRRGEEDPWIEVRITLKIVMEESSRPQAERFVLVFCVLPESVAPQLSSRVSSAVADYLSGSNALLSVCPNYCFTYFPGITA